MSPRTCAECGDTFTPRAVEQRACSFRCARAMLPRKAPTWKTIEKWATRPRRRRHERPQVAEGLAETRARLARLRDLGRTIAELRR